MIDFYTVESLITAVGSFVLFLVIRYQLFKNKLQLLSPGLINEPGEFKPNKEDLKYIHGGGR